jgi:DNA-binding MarR family transcriptional regulator
MSTQLPADRAAASDLVSALHHAVQDHLRNIAAAYGLTLTQAAAIRGLEVPVTQRDLAAQLCCEPSNVTFIVDRLQADGYLEREPHPHDRRAKLLALTDAGRELRRNLLNALQDNPPLGGIDDASILRLEESLGSVLNRLRQTTTGLPAR